MSLWPPFLGAGIRVREISEDWRYVRVELLSGRLNRNYVGTHFGGSLFAMTDPFLMLMYLEALGSECVVWDHSAAIRFVKPGRGTVAAEFRLAESDLDDVRRAVAGGDRYLKEHEVQVFDAEGECVATVRRTLYFRLKERYRPPEGRGARPPSGSGR
ncbi:DUF4442 domain-containing protein [Halomonas denitrificans]